MYYFLHTSGPLAPDTGGSVISKESLKHNPQNPSETELVATVVLAISAALAAWPVIALMHNGAQARPWQRQVARA